MPGDGQRERTVVDGIGELLAMGGRTLGPSEPLLIDQARIDRFSDATDDRQWIHVDPERAAASPFGGTIAHGYLSLSLCPYFLSELLEVCDVSMTVNYGADRVRFPSPVRSGASLEATATFLSVEDLGTAAQVKIGVALAVPGAAKPACVADVVYRFYP